jgi:protoheme IX farnesyltransferase
VSPSDLSPTPPATIEIGLGGRLADWAVLCKLRLASLVTFAAFVGALLASGPAGDLLRAAEAAFWITCSAAAGGVLNQVLEREADGLMERTRNRPLPTGRIAVRDAIIVALALTGAAVAGLALRFNLYSALLALGTLFGYVAIYTPLKRFSTLNTLVGSLPGAAPPLIGYVALAGGVDGWAWALFAIILAWQFPHFMAIAWIHREDYRRAGMRMLPTIEDGESAAGRQALAYSLVLLPVAMLPSLWGIAGNLYTCGAPVLGLGYCLASLAFAMRQTSGTARALLWASLTYLPLLFSLILFDQALLRPVA